MQLEELKSNPRKFVNECILNNDTEKLMIMAAQMHGHYCPGLALGIMASTFAMKQFDETSDGMENLLAIIETNNCVSDGIQFVTGCSFGNNSLIFKDIGKVAFTLTKRDGSGIRISTLPNSKEYTRTAHPYFSQKYKEVVGEQKRENKNIEDFKKLGIEAAFSILKLDFNKIFKVENIKVELPEYAPSHPSIFCDRCGENIMETRIIKSDKNRCMECSNSEYFQLDGSGISLKK